MAGLYSDYYVDIDWGNHHGLNLSDFEQTLTDWNAEGSGGLPGLAFDTVTYYQGSQSMKVSWPNTSAWVATPASVQFTFDNVSNGFDTGQFDNTILYPYIWRDLTGLISGRTYTVSAWVFKPTSSGQHVTLSIEDRATSAVSTLTNTWENLTVTFTATGTTHRLRMNPVSPPTAAVFTYIDYVSMTAVWDSTLILSAGGLKFEYGRDSSRALAPISPGSASFQVWNINGLYSPDNAGTPLYGQLSPGRQVRVVGQATGDVRRNLFMGYIDGYDLNPHMPVATVDFTCHDALGLLAQTAISTEVVASGTTGQLINAVLDAVGWPSDLRDIDAGSTVVSWWHAHETNALESIQQLCDSEGSPAYVSSDGGGRFIFRDRQHRMLNTRSNTVQATFYPLNEDGGYPVYSDPLNYDVGWKDIINSCTFNVDVRVPDPAGKQVVWSSTDKFVLSPGQTKVFEIVSETPFWGAVAPDDPYVITGPNEPLNDIALSGGTATTSISRTSGRSLTLTVTCLTGTVTVTRVRVRATMIIVDHTVSVKVEDAESIVSNKLSTFSGSGPIWASAPDAQIIASNIVATRSERKPTIKFRVVNGSTENVAQINQRDLSDRIHIYESNLGLNHDFFIESISHAVSNAGMFHEVEFGAERSPLYVPDSPFTFDSSTAGFDSGKFEEDGHIDATKVFILDQSSLDQKSLGF